MRNAVIISSESIENDEEYNGIASGSAEVCAACLKRTENRFFNREERSPTLTMNIDR